MALITKFDSADPGKQKDNITDSSIFSIRQVVWGSIVSVPVVFWAAWFYFWVHDLDKMIMSYIEKNDITLTKIASDLSKHKTHPELHFNLRNRMEILQNRIQSEHDSIISIEDDIRQMQLQIDNIDRRGIRIETYLENILRGRTPINLLQKKEK